MLVKLHKCGRGKAILTPNYVVNAISETISTSLTKHRISLISLATEREISTTPRNLEVISTAANLTLCRHLPYQ